MKRAVFSIFFAVCMMLGVPVSAGGSSASIQNNCVSGTPGASFQCIAGNAYGTSNTGTFAANIGVAGQAIDNPGVSAANAPVLYGGYFVARPSVNRSHVPIDDATGALIGMACNTTVAGTPCAKGTDVLYIGCEDLYFTRGQVCGGNAVAIDTKTDNGVYFSSRSTSNFGINLADGNYAAAQILIKPGQVITAAIPSAPGGAVQIIQVLPDGTVAIGGGGQMQLHPDGSTDVYGYVTFHAGHN
jgi:hypothetical protein